MNLLARFFLVEFSLGDFGHGIACCNWRRRVRCLGRIGNAYSLTFQRVFSNRNRTRSTYHSIVCVTGRSLKFVQ